MTHTLFEPLIGHQIGEISVSEGEESLRIGLLDAPDVVIGTGADCCSETWWADITGAMSTRGGTVMQVRELELCEPTDHRTRQEYDQAYGYAVYTTKGVLTLVFRNSSNGYYGGWALAGSEAGQSWRAIESEEWSA